MPFHCMHGISLSHVEPKESQLKSRNRKGEAVKSFEETCSFYEQQHCLKVKVWSEKEENVFLKMPLQHKDAFPPIVHICASKRLLLGVGRCCCPYSVHSIRVPNTHNGWMFFFKASSLSYIYLVTHSEKVSLMTQTTARLNSPLNMQLWVMQIWNSPESWIVDALRTATFDRRALSGFNHMNRESFHWSSASFLPISLVFTAQCRGEFQPWFMQSYVEGVTNNSTSFQMQW